MSLPSAIDDATGRLHEALGQLELPFATSNSEEFEATFSVIARRAGAKLAVHPCPERSAFAALAHAKPQFTVSLKGVEAEGEIEVLRRAASRVVLPKNANAIPFMLLRGGGKTRGGDKLLCGAAVRGGLDGVLALVGHGHGDLVPLEGVLIGLERIVAFGLDSHSNAFGRIVVDEPTSALTQLDLDGRSLGLRLRQLERSWQLDAEVTGRQKAISLELARRLGVPLRRFVKVDATTSRLEVFSAD